MTPCAHLDEQIPAQVSQPDAVFGGSWTTILAAAGVAFCLVLSVASLLPAALL